MAASGEAYEVVINGKKHFVGALNAENEDAHLFTAAQVAQLKGVTQATIYKAIAEGRLEAVSALNRVALTARSVKEYQPTRYKDRKGAKGRGGRPKGSALSEEHKARIAEAQARRWEKRKAVAQGSGT